MLAKNLLQGGQERRRNLMMGECCWYEIGTEVFGWLRWPLFTGGWW